MRVWTLSALLTVSLLILNGCGAKPKPSQESSVDKTLPIIELTKNGTFPDMNAIAFEWKPIEDIRVEGIYIYKKITDKSGKSKQSYYHTITNRFATHFVDNNVKPDTKYSYLFKTYSDEAESVASEVVTVNSLPILDSVSWIHSVTGMPRSAKLLWRPHTNEKVKAYIVERKTLDDKKYEEVARVKGRLNVEFIDTDLKDRYVYNYRVRALTYDEIISTPSEIVRVITKALPQKVENIVASVNLPKRIELNWDKSTDEDFDLYYVYRADSLTGRYKAIATLHNNHHVDEVATDGAQYFYKVTVMDKDGLESSYNKNPIIGMTLLKPLAPKFVEAKLVNDAIEIYWKNLDNRTDSYVVKKKTKKGWFDAVSEDISGVMAESYVDTNITSNANYTYTIYAVDKNAIVSKPSHSVSVKTPESNKIIELKAKRD